MDLYGGQTVATSTCRSLLPQRLPSMVKILFFPYYLLLLLLLHLFAVNVRFTTFF